MVSRNDEVGSDEPPSDLITCVNDAEPIGRREEVAKLARRPRRGPDGFESERGSKEGTM